MKRIFLLTLLFSLYACGDENENTKKAEAPQAEQVSPLAKYEKSGVEMALQKVSEHVYYVQGKAGIATDNEGFISNAAAIITNEGVVVVDALGSPSLAALFLEKLKMITDKPVIKVIVTHYHADHIYGLQVFKEQGAEIIAPAGYLDYADAEIGKSRLEERRESLDPFVNEDTYIVKADRVLDKNTQMTVGDITLDIHYLGTAHSSGDLSVLVVNDAVLVSGDIIFEGRVPFTGGADTAHWLEVLEKLDNSNLKALIPGHGPAAKEPAEAIKLTLNYLKTVRTAMQEAVENLMSFDEAYDLADWSAFENLPAFGAAHRRNVYGVFLSLEADSMSQ
ncbi:MAG: MBL-fold metallo-hydrolase superfamily [uncultured Thiotrichaceae bacterium]|uniref:MBL-fold metallo-hydrolase superfamily n=1 Tax=uncultured Thiotrichaceae bacterium TaxID=298394 RepID=A0A6S6UEK1_9GAMM|nr:MAG: MBL-fold metallo-hydrolase superfamily [uncultured Thiotrichaceae bacterium]